MRKDVRLGFGVGGVLLAVIIIAVLVVHRNHNKAVAFDTSGKSAAGTDSSGNADVTVAPADSGKALEQPTSPAPTKQPDAKGQPDGGSAQDQWDALFASSTSPLKSRMRNSQPQSQVDSTPSDPPPANDPKPDADKPAPTTDNAPTQAAATSTTSTRSHTVKPGETLSSIAKLVYGDARQYKTILAANPGLDATKMRAGTVIQLPPASSIKAKESPKKNDAASGGVTPVSDSKTYVVQSGDSLYKITRKLYGTSENQEKLYEINKQTIGPDSTRLKPGMVLKLPAAPTAQ